MKRRLNILCLVVMLVLSYSVLEQGYYIFLGAKMGAQTGLELGKKGSDIAAYKELMNLKVVNLIPSSMESFDFFRDSVYNEKSRSYVPAAYSSLMVSVDSHDSVGKVVAKYLLIYLHLGFSLWAVVLFIVYPLDNLYQQVRHLQLAECTSAASIGNGTGCQLLLYLCVIIS